MNTSAGAATKAPAEVGADVAIIGGGLAGAAAACAFARRGISTVLFEPRAQSDGLLSCSADSATPKLMAGRRAKCCGHCLHGRVRASLAALELTDCVDRIAHGRTTRARIERRGVPALEFELADPGFVVRRDELDPALLDEARRRGVVIIAQSARWSPRENLVRSDSVECRPKLVVGADGLSSRVARDAGLVEHGRQGRRFGLAFDFEADAELADALVEEGTIRMIVADGGYLGLVRERHAVHAGLLLDAKVSARDALARIGTEHREIGAIPQSILHQALACASGAGPIPFRTTSAWSDGLALIGDAAGYVEPFTGEGMTWAFESAALLDAAVAASTSLDAVPARYGALRSEALAWTTRRCRAIAWVVARPRLVTAALRFAQCAPSISRRILQGVVR